MSTTGIEVKCKKSTLFSVIRQISAAKFKNNELRSFTINETRFYVVVAFETPETTQLLYGFGMIFSRNKKRQVLADNNLFVNAVKSNGIEIIHDASAQYVYGSGTPRL